MMVPSSVDPAGSSGAVSPVLDSRNPVRLYLARLAPGSRPKQYEALRYASRLLWNLDAPEHAPWPRLTYEMAVAVQTRMLADYAPATAHRVRAALRRVMQECWRAGLITAEQRDRVSDLEPIRASREPAGRYVSEAEVLLMLDQCSLRDRALIAVAVGTGLRRAELAGLTPRSITWGRGRAKLTVIGKGNKQRSVYVVGRAARELAALCRTLPPDAPSVFGTSVSHVRSIVVRASRRAGVPRVTTHDLRRSYASWALERGADLAIVQRTMGHADPKTTARYDRRGDDASRKVAELLTIKD